MVLLSHGELQALVDSIMVGQVWKCIEDNRLVMISMVKPNEIRGYIFTGFEVTTYISLAPIDFVRYFELALNPRPSVRKRIGK
jgi:hypothetical protein